MTAHTKPKYKIRKQKVFSSLGFTLVELLIVMGVLGALATVVLVSIGPANQQRSRDTIRRSDLKQYQTEMEIFANTNNGNYPNAPANIGALCGDLGLLGAACKNDPQGGAYEVWSTPAAYELFATLEYEPSGTTNYFVVCSNGLSGDTAVDPAGAGCSL